jgi:hypothetical protein
MTSLINKLSLLTITIIITLSSNANAQSPLKVDAGADINLCLGDYTELHAMISGGVEPYIISWTPDVELSATDIENPTVSPTIPTVYRVAVTDAAGAVAKDEIKVKVSPKPEVITNNSITVAAGETVALSADAQGGSAPYYYNWKPNTGISGVNTANPTVTAKFSTVYNVIVKDSKGCTATGQVNVIINGGKVGMVEGNR